MSSPEEFARECDVVASALRRIPREVRRELSQRVKQEVAVPLAAAVGRQAHGPWQRVLTAGSKARAGADPKIIIGGKTPRLSGGGGPRDVVFGAEFGGGSRTTTVPARGGRKAYRRRSTRQFARHYDPFVYPTIVAELPEVLDTYADIVLDVMDQEVNT